MPNTFIYTGNVASTPTLRNPGTDKSVCTFNLLRNEYAGTGNEERQVDIQFTCFGGRGEAIAKNAMVGDQLIVTARIANNNYVPQGGGEKVYGFSFIVEDWEFGAPGKAKRESLANR